jgi:hypothetical protein
MAGGFEFFEVGGQVESEYFRFLAEGQQDVFFLELHELFDFSCVRFALADHFVLVDVQEVDFADVRADY